MYMFTKSYKQENSDSPALSGIIEINVENLAHLVLTRVAKYKDHIYAWFCENLFVFNGVWR